MTLNKRELLEGGLIIAGGAALIWLLNRSAGTAAQAGEQAGLIPPYLGYNQPNNNTIPATNLPTLGTPGSNGSNAPSCACGGGTTYMFSTDNAYAQSLADNANSFLTQYEQSVMGQFPNFVSQFFNNQAAISEQSVNLNELQVF